jgi:ABC-2 type transport system ATP-binding protein
MLTLNSVSKIYPGLGPPALDGITCALAPGQITGLIGPNGAGKTTLLRIMAAILPPSSGTILYRGTDTGKMGAFYRRQVGYMPEDGDLYLKLKPLQNLIFYRSFYPHPVSTVELKELLSEYELEDALDKQAGGLSRGTRQKILFIKSIINKPDLLLLDEPLNSLDPAIRVMVKNRLRQLRDGGKLVLISSHSLHEIEDLCDSVIIIRNGRIVCFDTLVNLRQGFPGQGNHSLEELYLRIMMNI